MNKYATYSEITSQTEAWAQALEIAGSIALPSAQKYNQVLFTGCGSTYYLSIAAASLYQELTGSTARAISGGELLLNPQIIFQNTNIDIENKILLIAISRSGTTTETLRAVQNFKKQKRGDVLVIGNYYKELSNYADYKIIIPKGQEESVAQTRSFASMYVATTAFCARMAGREDLVQAMTPLPKVGNDLIEKYEVTARRVGEDLHFDRFYYLGSGIRYGVACEVNLKMKEMSLTHSEAFHFLEFRHGPKSMVDGNTAVVGLLSEANLVYERNVLNEINDLGGKVITLADNDADISFRSYIPEQVRTVLYLPFLQLMSFYRSIAKGLNPDRPKNLTAVIELDV